MKHELLAPAGNLEAGYAALYYGADALYLGLKKFSARAGAQNFSYDELDELTAYAHALHKKVFVAINTLLSQEEIKELPEIIAFLRKIKIDAVILQDLGVFYLFKKLAPEIELHASTQMAVHNVEGARFLQSLGFKRVVLARELTLNEIKKIAEALPQLDLEVFVHGALCYSYSGQCLFSALEFGKSANRGRCIYPCRDNYQLVSKDGCEKKCLGHFFSMKDLALEELVKDVPALSLKIEGRKKSPLYVAAVTQYYRHILDGKKKNINEANDIKQIFSRPWCQFHFKGKDKNVTDREFVGHRGLVIGQVVSVSHNRLVFKPNVGVARYDGLQIDVKGDEKPYGFGIKNMYVNRQAVYEAKAFTTVEVELPNDHPRLDIGAPVYLASSTLVKGKYDYKKPKPKEYMHQDMKALQVVIEKDKIWALSDVTSVSIRASFDKANDMKKVEEAIRGAFAKTGGTGIIFNDIMIENPLGLFVPVSILNQLRRQLVDELLQNNDKEVLELPHLKACPKVNEAKKIETLEINLEFEVLHLSQDTLLNTWFVMPQIYRFNDKLKSQIDALYQNGARHFIVENYYGFEMLKKYKDIEIASGSFIYVMNSYAAACLKDMGVCWATLALESSLDNMKEVIDTSPLSLVQVISDHPPLFTSAVCIRDNKCADCDKKRKEFLLKAKGREYKAVSANCSLKLYSLEKYQRPLLDGVMGFIDRG